MVAPWPREHYVAGGGPGEIALIALSAARLPDPLPVSRSRHGMPDEGDGPAAAAIVIDVYAARAHLGSAIAALAPERDLDVMHEVTLFFEELDDQTIAAWSLGLRKFGRPELVLLGLDPDAATEAALLLRDLAQALADGERIEPGDSVGTPAGLQWTVERFAPERWPKIAVDGDAIVMRRRS